MKNQSALNTLPESVHAEMRLRLPAVLALVGFSRSKLFMEVKAGRFPQPERLGKRCSRWRMADVLAYLAARKVAA